MGKKKAFLAMSGCLGETLHVLIGLRYTSHLIWLIHIKSILFLEGLNI